MLLCFSLSNVKNSFMTNVFFVKHSVTFIKRKLKYFTRYSTILWRPDLDSPLRTNFELGEKQNQTNYTEAKKLDLAISSWIYIVWRWFRWGIEENSIPVPYFSTTYITGALLVAALFGIVKHNIFFISHSPASSLPSLLSVSGEASYRRIKE